MFTMGGTIWKQLNEEQVNERCQHPGWAAALTTCVRQMNDGFWDSDYLDIFLQKWDRFRTYTIYDANAFSEIHAALCSGKILLAHIHVGSEPQSDSEIEENDLALSQIEIIEYHLYDDAGLVDAAPIHFSGEFWGKKTELDGLFEWDEPIHFSIKTAAGELIDQNINPQCLPLEVGFTNAWTSLGHLIQERGLARWPYHSQVVTLCKVIDDSWHTVDYGIVDPPEPTSGLLKPRRELGRVIRPEVVTAQQLSLFE